jgi:hypothetical protein
MPGGKKQGGKAEGQPCSLPGRQAGRQARSRPVPGGKHKIVVEHWLMLVICKHDTSFDCASSSIDWY